MNRLPVKPYEAKQPSATNTLRDDSKMDQILQVLNIVNVKQEILIEKQDVMIETQEVIIRKLNKANHLMEMIVKKSK